MAAMMFFTSASALALASGGKYSATYSLPSASPSTPEVMSTPRFQRGACSGWPPSVLEYMSKLASTKALGRKAAASRMVWKAM